MDGPLLMQSLLQRVENEADVRSSRHAPADDAAGLGVDGECHIPRCLRHTHYAVFD